LGVGAIVIVGKGISVGVGTDFSGGVGVILENGVALGVGVGLTNVAAIGTVVGVGNKLEDDSHAIPVIIRTITEPSQKILCMTSSFASLAPGAKDS